MESLQSLWECDDELSDFDDADEDQMQPAAAPPALAQPSFQEPLEDGEIGPASGSLHPGCGFQFTANDLDAAIRNAKKTKKAKRVAKTKGKRRKKSDGKKAREMDPEVFVARTSRYLKEPKRYLIKAAVERLGIDIVRDLVREVETIEKNGGQIVADGRRRRTPGGVLWNVLRSRYKEDYKAIMTAGRNFEKQQRQQKRKGEGNDMVIDGQQKRKGEVNDMVIDGQPATKRRRTEATRSGIAPPAAQVKRTGVTLWPSRRTQMDDLQSKVDPDNARTLTRVQNAWAEGVKKGTHIAASDDMDTSEDAMKTKRFSVAERLRMPIQYDDL